jgi:hypothetical protein
MNTIEKGMQVKYIGKTNDFTYKEDLKENSIGIVKNVFEVRGKITCQIEFQNGLIATIDLEDLKELSLNEERTS